MLKSKEEMVADLLRESLFNGEVPPLGKLPGVLELSKRIGVSGNTVVKAAAILRREGLISSKPGKGTFSAVNSIRVKAHCFTASIAKRDTNSTKEGLNSSPNGCGWQEQRKPLRVLCEDSADWQRAFWNSLRIRFMDENPDIDLVLLQGDCDWTTENIDMYIGGESSARELKIRSSFGMDLSALSKFGLPDYSRLILTPERCGTSTGGAVLPLAYVEPLLLANQAFRVPDLPPDAGVSDFIVRGAELNGEGFQYQIWVGSRLLSNCGISFDREDIVADLVRCRSKLETLRELKRQSHLSWKHTECHFTDDIFAFLAEDLPRVCETAPQLQILPGTAGLRKLDYPRGRFFSPIPIIAAISARTPFPEEALRFVKLLLKPDCQRLIAEKLFLKPLDDGKVELQSIDLTESNIQKANLIGWEFYYYLLGKTRDFESFCHICQTKLEHLTSLGKSTGKNG